MGRREGGGGGSECIYLAVGREQLGAAEKREDLVVSLLHDENLPRRRHTEGVTMTKLVLCDEDKASKLDDKYSISPGCWGRTYLRSARHQENDLYDTRAAWKYHL